MAVELRGQTVTGVRLFGAPREYRDIHLVDVTLKACVLVRRDDLEFKNVVRNAVLERCRMDACGAQGVFRMAHRLQLHKSLIRPPQPSAGVQPRQSLSAKHRPDMPPEREKQEGKA
jgi:hypothetical protein